MGNGQSDTNRKQIIDKKIYGYQSLDKIILKCINRNEEIKNNSHFIIKTTYNVSYYLSDLSDLKLMDNVNILNKHNEDNEVNEVEINDDVSNYIVIDKNYNVRYILTCIKDGCSEFNYDTAEKHKYVYKQEVKNYKLYNINQNYFTEKDNEKLTIETNDNIVNDVINMCIDINNYKVAIKKLRRQKPIVRAIKKYNKKYLRYKKAKK